MARKPKIEPIGSRDYEVLITRMVHESDLKRVWRRSKTDFESACRFMDYSDLFSTGGVKLP